MFAQRVVKPQTKKGAHSINQLEPQRSTFSTRPLGGSAVEQALFLQRMIGNQAAQRLLRQNSRLTESEPKRQDEKEADPTSAVLGTTSDLSWDFSKIPSYPPNRPNGRRTGSFLATPSATSGIQMKLEVGSVNDPLEHKADRVADQVLATFPQNKIGGAPPTIQRFSEHAHPILDLQATISNQAVQRLLRTRAEAFDAGTATTPHSLGHHSQTSAGEHHLNHSNNIDQASVLIAACDLVRSTGRPLDPAVRAEAEVRLGFDFSRVRIHDDDVAANSADAAHARAYTVGSHIAFARGEYQPHASEGAHLLFHELVHVVQQGREASTSDVPRFITQPHDPAEQEARALTTQAEIGAPTPFIVNSPGAAIARYPKEGEELQKRESEALQHGQNPYELAPEPIDPFQRTLRDLVRNMPPPAPPQIFPGSRNQQEEAIPEVNAIDLFDQPAIQTRLKAIAADAEAREAAKPGGKVEHTVDKLMAYWKDRFVNSVDYILYRRGGGQRQPRLNRLHAEEVKLVRAAPIDIVAQVEALRRKSQSDWLAEVQRAADQFVILAENEAKFATVHQEAKSVKVFGLPESIEGTVKASDHPDVVEATSTPIAPSVVRFMEAVQKESKIKAVAENYPEHEKANPWVGDPKGIGKYSFDVHLEGFVKKNDEGFYDRKPLIDYFLAVDRAAAATKIEWVAFYNDFEVAKTVNEKLGKIHIGFSGGGGVAPFSKGSFHHGPAPYVLHIHFNIMPIDLKENFDQAMALKPLVDKVILPFLEILNPK